ncbi:MAG: ribonuclease E/G, partial [Methylobacteriaceae bacterium]|nr:ribonuclease E/G [Methylobacteriaceae bacterium]
KMLIDASHPEETRVVALRGNRVEEFDFESANKKQLRGNIYLAKVIRVEPSLQAAFVDYGGNRHGFLAFAEIHPDYYQIPVADRQALLEEEARAQRSEDEESERPQRRSRRNRRDGAEKRRRDEAIAAPVDDAAPGAADVAAEGETDEAAPTPAVADRTAYEPRDEDIDPHAASLQAPVVDDAPLVAAAMAAQDAADAARDDEPTDAARDEAATQATDDAAPAAADAARPADDDDAEGDEEDEGEETEADVVEQMGGDAMEEVPYRPVRTRRQYKIQEVIRRRQVLLVQVVKEERGNKGAALTTYLSLAGRYSVLMPNTARGGGISRKITDGEDRKRLKAIAQELEVPDGMGVIVRTAGAARTKAEVKRDFEYLMRMWETVRETTLRSTAPTLVYEDGSLIKRAIRDLYSKEIEEILVAGQDGFREARDFMRLLMPSHARHVTLYGEPQPLFARYGVEQQLDGMFSNHVTLKSGGYIVINQTEALVAIDVNSGRSTREHNIEDTALRTNLEAADEVARQLRLRDLAGLVVVDFIDMEESRNNRAVERRMKEALKNDRARIQIGRISHFGLLEMSRQRIRTGVLEGSTIQCPHCMGAGTVRSTASIALHVLRVLEDALMRSAAYDLTIRTRSPVALYILNQKRAHLLDLEMRFGVALSIVADDSLTGPTLHVLERGEPASGVVQTRLLGAAPAIPQEDADAADEADAPEAEEETAEVGDDEATDGEDADGGRDESRADGEEGENGRRRRRRRRRRGRGDRPSSGVAADAPQPSDDALAELALIGGDLPVATVDAEDADAPREDGAADSGREGGRRRRRRGGRGAWRGDAQPLESSGWRDEAATDAPAAGIAPDPDPAASGPTPDEAPAAEVAAPIPAPIPAPERFEPHLAPAPGDDATPEPPPAPRPDVESLPEAAQDPARPKRSGWWQRAKAGFTGG